jgi:hypothetical protein
MLRRSIPVVLAALTCAALGPATGAAAGLSDSFDGAVDVAPGYGLNDSLAARQGLSPAVTYTRVPGVWYPAPPPPASYSQVGPPGRLTFSQGTSAIRVDAPAVTGPDGRVTLGATVDPIVGDTGSGAWVSLLLSRDAAEPGYVSDTGVDVAVLVRSQGGVQVFQAGKLAADLPRLAPPDAQGRYAVEVSFAAGSRVARVTVNGVARGVTVGAPLPGRVFAFAGAYLDAPGSVSTVDDLSIGEVDRSALSPAAGSRLGYFGYYAARLAPEGAVTGGGNHVPEVRGRSNLNWVNISDPDRYASEVLSTCAPKSCVVYAGNEFFQGCDAVASPSCTLYPNYVERWNRLADAVRPYLDRVAAFSVLDEPYHRGASPQDVQSSAATMKATFPGVPVLMIEAGPSVTPGMVVPDAVDWVSFDWYCHPIGDIEQTLNVLESRSAGKPVLLVPEAAPLRACGGAPGHATDADIAALQWDYFHLAERHPRVIGLLAFGPWVSGYKPADLPLTTDAQERIAARILPAPPAAPSGGGPQPPVATPRDRTAPRVTRIRLTRRRLSLRLSEPATVSATIARRTRHGRHLRWTTVARRTLHARTAGSARARLRTLRRGRYRVTVRARDAAGNRSPVIRRRARVR